MPVFRRPPVLPEDHVTTPSQPNTALIDGVRAFYEQTARLAATEMPDSTWPDFDDLTSRQLRLWMLACAATAEVAVRMTDAVVSITEDA